MVGFNSSGPSKRIGNAASNYFSLTDGSAAGLRARPSGIAQDENGCDWPRYSAVAPTEAVFNVGSRVAQQSGDGCRPCHPEPASKTLLPTASEPG